MSSSLSSNDEAFLREAILLAAELSQRRDGGPFGAIVVRDGTILSRGWNQVTSANDPTAHAEVIAIRAAWHFGEIAPFLVQADGVDMYAQFAGEIDGAEGFRRHIGDYTTLQHRTRV